jgi:iron complex transport system ATP-binding protein
LPEAASNRAPSPVSPLQAKSVSFGYGAEFVVGDVSFAVEPGEMLGIIGPNGSGKSTLMRLLSGVLAPRRGEVRLFDRPMPEHSRRDVARAIAVVPQESSIEFPYSVTEVVLMGRSPHFGGFAFEGDRDVEIAHAAMRRTRVEHLARRSIHELSGGERQRVILARALAQEAPIMLLDEPAAFLDIRHEVEIYDLLHDLQQEGKSIVTVLHDLNLAALYCDRVGLLRNGRLLQLGSPDEVITYAAITDVYETEVYVDRNDITGAVNVLPLSRKYRDALAAGGALGTPHGWRTSS